MRPEIPLIQGKTRLVAIFGWPLTYTLSPVFQNLALRRGGQDAVYVALPAPDETVFLGLARGLMRSPHFVGANITNPYKTAAKSLVRRLTPAARAIGAVNTLARQGSAWLGDNTDAAGFLESLRQAKLDLRGRRVLVLGAGGAARAVVWACGQARVRRVLVLARRRAQAGLAARLAGKAGHSGDLDPGVLGLASLGADLVVNTLPGEELGRTYGRAMIRRPKTGALAMDISYVPVDTAFLQEARVRGWRSLDGLTMLVEQGRLAYAAWFGTRPTAKPLHQAVRLAQG